MRAAISVAEESLLKTRRRFKRRRTKKRLKYRQILRIGHFKRKLAIANLNQSIQIIQKGPLFFGFFF